jgi:hypothetical protein
MIGKVGLVLSLLISIVARGQDLRLTKRFEHRWPERGWRIHAHRDAAGHERLVALNQDSLRVEILDPTAAGRVISADRLDTSVRHPRLLETLGLKNGEFLVAFSRPDHGVELHTVGSDVSYEVAVDSVPISLQLLEADGGAALLAVATRTQVEIFRRDHDSMEPIRRVAIVNGLKQDRLLRAGNGELMLVLFSDDLKTRALVMDQRGEDAEEILNLSQPPGRIEAALDANGVLLLASVGHDLRFYRDGQVDLDGRGGGKSRDRVVFPVNSELGAAKWIPGAGGAGHPMFAAVRRDVGGVIRLVLHDPEALTGQPVELAAGDARSIENVGVLNIGKKTFYFFVRDHKYLCLQNENEVAVISSSAGERLVDVTRIGDITRIGDVTRKGDAVRTGSALAVTTESDAGTRFAELVSH